MIESSPNASLCPSAQPDMLDAAVFGIVLGEVAAPRVAYLKRGVAIDPAAVEGLGATDPTHVFRFSGRCEEGRCAQFTNGRCSLGQRVATQLAPVADTLPPCRIRDNCRWHAEQGRDVCLRCPQVVTLVPRDDDRLAAVALPRDEAGAAFGREGGV